MIWVKDWNEDRDDVDIFNIIQKVRHTVIHLKIDKRANGGSHEEVRGKREELGSSLNNCQGYDTQMLFIHRLK